MAGMLPHSGRVAIIAAEQYVRKCCQKYVQEDFKSPTEFKDSLWHRKAPRIYHSALFTLFSVQSISLFSLCFFHLKCYKMTEGSVQGQMPNMSIYTMAHIEGNLLVQTHKCQFVVRKHIKTKQTKVTYA